MKELHIQNLSSQDELCKNLTIVNVLSQVDEHTSDKLNEHIIFYDAEEI